MKRKHSLASWQRACDNLVALGAAYKGTDGRYRVREDVEVINNGDGSLTVVPRVSN